MLREAIFIWIMIIALVISAWEFIKSLRRLYLGRHHTWITFDTPEEARVAADDVSRFTPDGMINGDVEMGVSWSPGAIGIDSSTPRIMVRIPHTLIGRHNAGLTQQNYREHIKQRVGVKNEAG